MSELKKQDLINALTQHTFIEHLTRPNAPDHYWLLTQQTRNFEREKHQEHIQGLRQASLPLATIIDNQLTKHNHLRKTTLKEAIHTYLTNAIPKHQYLLSTNITLLIGSHHKGFEQALRERHIKRYTLGEFLDDIPRQTWTDTKTPLYCKDFARTKRYITRKALKHLLKNHEHISEGEVISWTRNIGIYTPNQLVRLALRGILNPRAKGWPAHEVHELLNTYQKNTAYKQRIDNIVNKKKENP